LLVKILWGVRACFILKLYGLREIAYSGSKDTYNFFMLYETTFREYKAV
jgi:hypothetical protein